VGPTCQRLTCHMPCVYWPSGVALSIMCAPATLPGHVHRPCIKAAWGAAVRTHLYPKPTAAAPEAACQNAAHHRCLSVPCQVSRTAMHHRAAAATHPSFVSPRRSSSRRSSELLIGAGVVIIVPCCPHIAVYLLHPTLSCRPEPPHRAP
jgi:hypothetical protein